MTTKMITETEKKFRDQIHQLVLVAETFLKYAEEISTYYDEIKEKVGLAKLFKTKLIYLLIMQQRLYFQETILILCSLFEKPGKKQEISFESYKKYCKEEVILNEIDRISSEFKNSAFFRFRNHLLAHKDKKYSRNQISAYLNPIEQSHIQDLRAFIEKVKIILKTNWIEMIGNNYFANSYDPGFKCFFGIAKKEISSELIEVQEES